MIYNNRSEIELAVIDSYSKTYKGELKRLYNCKAWILETDSFDFTVLQSYSSIVAAYQRSTGILGYSASIPTQLRSTLQSSEIEFDTNIKQAGIIRAR